MRPLKPCSFVLLTLRGEVVVPFFQLRVSECDCLIKLLLMHKIIYGYQYHQKLIDCIILIILLKTMDFLIFRDIFQKCQMYYERIKDKNMTQDFLLTEEEIEEKYFEEEC